MKGHLEKNYFDEQLEMAAAWPFEMIKRRKFRNNSQKCCERDLFTYDYESKYKQEREINVK